MIQSTGPQARTWARGLAPALLPVLALVLAACTGSEAAPDGPPAAGPGPSPSARPVGTAAPTLPPGPGGRTPVFSHGPRDGDKVVALTFDADMTPSQAARAAGGERFDNPVLIRTLRRMRVPATVFMTGRWAEEYPDQARSLGRDPLLEVANHSYSHHAFASPCGRLQSVSPGAMRADVERAYAAIRRAGVPDPLPYVHFPGGCFDDRALRAVAPVKVTAVQGDVKSGDAFATSADRVVERVLSRVEPGSVVSLHCTLSTAPVTDEAVRRIVPELRARGYRFVRVSELIGAGQGAPDPGGTAPAGAGAPGQGRSEQGQPEQAVR
ncbi:polysaccharide deacetylase family protein [Streptomyces sp. NPDC004647]|uniref:polysaccharide deacetylase family protein n=1 Tax=Streptomyces sp. NPDC004647 TaxID=3154671 RepID=UPI0033A0438F